MTIYDCQPMTWAQFLAIENGTQVFNHQASECVALANQYNEGVLGGGFVNVRWAINWWDNPNVAAVHNFERITSNPQVGDIFIGSYGLYNAPYGHIGVVIRAWDGSTFGTMEQNVIGEYVTRHDRTMQNIDGFLRPINQAAIQAPTPIAIAGNQRVAGDKGVFRRAEPNTWSERLEPDLEAGVIGTFDGWINGEDRGGNPVWFRGALSGNWFWSGAFTDAGTHDLADLNPAPAPQPTEPAAPVKPEEIVTPENVPEVVPEPVTPDADIQVVEEPTDPTPVVPEPTPETPKPEEPAMPEPTPTPSASPSQNLTLEQWQAIIAKADAGNDSEEVAKYDLVSKEFWNYAAERVIKTFFMSFSGMLVTAGAAAVAVPGVSNVLAEIGWQYIVTSSIVSGLYSLGVALSSFKNIVTFKK